MSDPPYEPPAELAAIAAEGIITLEEARDYVAIIRALQQVARRATELRAALDAVRRRPRAPRRREREAALLLALALLAREADALMDRWRPLQARLAPHARAAGIEIRDL